MPSKDIGTGSVKRKSRRRPQDPTTTMEDRHRNDNDDDDCGGGQGEESSATSPPSLGDSDLEEDEDVAPSRPPQQEQQQQEQQPQENIQQRRRSSSLSLGPAPRRYLGLALALWIAHLILVISLKHMGIIEPQYRWEETVVNSVLEQSWRRLNESIPLSYLTMEKKRPGFQLAQQGATANYPVVLLPGFVTSGLEVWGGKECGRKHFRQRLWAAIGGAKSFLMDRDCWRDHMMLDPMTGGDPPDIRLRAAQGFEAADYFMGNYWVFGKLIENLADVGYDSSTMSMEPYDWRVAFPILEERDGYLTKLKHTIEAMHKTSGKKVVLSSHSMGAQLVHYFYKWVTTSESHGGGGGGRKWVDEHVHAYVNIAGPLLGVPKAATSLLSGEMSDTAFIGTMGQVLESFYGRRLRKDLWTSWGSLWTMLPKGGDALWGVGADMCSERSPEDPMCPKSGPSPLLVMTEPNKEDWVTGMGENITPSTGDNATQTPPVDAVLGEETVNETLAATFTPPLNPVMKDFVARKSHSLTETLDLLQSWGGGLGPDIFNAKMHTLHGKDSSSKAWHDPSRTPLPYVPNVRIYCFYGMGIETERAYYYKRNKEEHNSDDLAATPPTTAEPPAVLNADVVSEKQHVEYGIKKCDGDGSVPLLSLGYICADAWMRKDSGLNPSGAKVVTREYKHRAEFWVDDPMRGGPASADHVDILGNREMMEDFLRVVTGFEASTVNENRIWSDIEKISKQINDHPGGGIFARKWWR